MNELIEIIKHKLNIPLSIAPDTPLISTGIVDSFHMAALLVVLETYYHIHIDPADVGTDNFDTPRQIYRFIQASL